MLIESAHCEYECNPLGIDADRPRFSWILRSDRRDQRQSAYRILVAGSPEALSDGIGDRYDSGRVESDQSVNVPYAGPPLSSGERCFWKVQCWDSDGAPSPWSEPAWFEMGLLQPGDWEGAWIGADPEISAPLLRTKRIVPRNVKRARVYISGLGCYELYINGRRVGDHVLDPATTDYSKRILYATYDVTDFLVAGVNVIGVMLGNGFYSQPDEPNLTDAPHRYGDSPRLLMQMNAVLDDGSTLRLASDPTWRVSPGPIRFNSIVGGEVYDTRLEQPGWDRADFDDSHWTAASSKKNPGGAMESQSLPPMKVNQTLQPVRLSEPMPGVYVYDLGQCFGGWAKVRLHGPRGTNIIVKYGEYLEPGGLIDKRPYPGAQETNTYILKGGGEEVHEPRFTFHPVRYVQVEGHPAKLTLDDLEGRAVYSAVDLYGSFRCSDPLLNRTHRNVEWTFTNQSFGLPLDCLHREMCSPLDPSSVAGGLHTRKHIPLFWTKWLRDIRLSQKDGMLPDAAPNYRNLYPGDPWGSYNFLVWYVYLYFGDRQVLEENYDCMKAWVDYLTSTAEDHLIRQGENGDHMLPGKCPGEEEFMSAETPKPIIWNGTYYRNVLVLSRAAAVLGHAEDSHHYERLAKDIARAFHRKWFDADKKHYEPATQTANLFPLVLGVVPDEFREDVKRCVVRTIMEDHDGHLHTGTVGTTALVEALGPQGLVDVMYRVATTTTYPGWGYMIEQGATTIWESWGRFQPKNPRWRADSMMMWATIDRFLYEDLAGISGPGFYGPDFITPGFQTFRIQPRVPDGLQFAEASLKTVRGIIASKWRREKDAFLLDVSIPVNSRATVCVPKLGAKRLAVRESGTTVWNGREFVEGAAGVLCGVEESDHVAFDVGSGTYRFVAARE